jgi:translation initiation factor eIF-2B subunit epsilon
MLGAIIESNVTIDRAIICDGVKVGAGAVIPRGCVLSYGVTIAAGAVLPEFTRVARRDAEEEVGDAHICCGTCSALLLESLGV